VTSGRRPAASEEQAKNLWVHPGAPRTKKNPELKTAGMRHEIPQNHQSF